MIYYVAKNGNNNFDGTKNAPFLTINRAASIAVAGDKIIVRAGVYRECVTPAKSGTEASRIIYTVIARPKIPPRQLNHRIVLHAVQHIAKDHLLGLPVINNPDPIQ